MGGKQTSTLTCGTDWGLHRHAGRFQAAGIRHMPKATADVSPSGQVRCASIRPGTVPVERRVTVLTVRLARHGSCLDRFPWWLPRRAVPPVPDPTTDMTAAGSNIAGFRSPAGDRRSMTSTGRSASKTRPWCTVPRLGRTTLCEPFRDHGSSSMNVEILHALCRLPCVFVS